MVECGVVRLLCGLGLMVRCCVIMSGGFVSCVGLVVFRVIVVLC